MVMVVEPLPDELGKAHAGRIAYLNALPGLGKLLHRTLGPAKEHLKRNEFRQQFHYLATRLAIEPERYLAQHSMLPFLYAYSGRKNTGQMYMPLIRKWLKQADSPILQYVRSCPHCIQEQEANMGLSWWIRKHQLPGVDVCLEHKVPLIQVENQDALLRTPGFFLANSLFSTKSAPAWDHPTVSRYHEFASWLLSQPSRLHPEKLERCIKTQCGGLDIAMDIKKHVQHSSLSLYVRSAFPVDWLTTHYPVLIGENYQGREVGIDAAFRGQGATGQVIAMILASLFESPTHLLSKIEESPVHLPRLSSRRLPSIARAQLRSQEAFVQVYIQANGQANRIAALLNCQNEVIYRRLTQYGLPAMRRSKSQHRAQILKRLKDATPVELQEWGKAMQAHWQQYGKGNFQLNLSIYASLLGVI
ncbi:TniQ family protein [Vogesella oryzae]|uniref:TniQ family protein n=1 Tax=Vogesella oryzae TaxID=1735285 RepID=UPI001582A757|nr:TniQ family protein [Vogesella oryzae]